MLKLSNKIEIIVPQADNEGNVIDNANITYALNRITREAGGCTITDVQGQWFSTEENRIMTDNNKVYEWHYDHLEDDSNITGELQLIVTYLIKGYDQEAVSIKLNGELLLVFPEDRFTLAEELDKLVK